MISRINDLLKMMRHVFIYKNNIQNSPREKNNFEHIRQG